MSEVTIEKSELESLKEIADNMGIPYKGNIGVTTLKGKIENQRAALQAVEPSQASKNKRQELVNDATRLIRVQILALDPRKESLTGEYITVYNNIVGQLTKYVDYNNEYHIPNFMVKVLKEKKHRISYEVRDHVTGRKTTKNKMVQSYNIAILDPLTDKELKDLAIDQRKREFNRED